MYLPSRSSRRDAARTYEVLSIILLKVLLPEINKYSIKHKFKYLYIRVLEAPAANHFTKTQGDQDLVKVSTILSAMEEVSSRY